MPLDGVGTRIATDTYIGDGTLSQAITGVGFQPRFVWIFNDPGIDGGAGTVAAIDVGTAGLAWLINTGQTRDNRIISLDADPNTDGVTYRYLALG